MRTPHRSSRLTAALIAVALTTGTLATATSAAADPASSSDSTVASGDGWTVTDLGGMYQVTLDLDRPLEVRSDAPTIVVDGEALGLATESATGRTLTALTDDASVLTATSVRAGWFSDAGGAASVKPKDVDPAPEPGDIEYAPEGTPDPSVPGEYSYSKALYSFGNQAIELAGIGGIRGEVEGKVYLPDTEGAAPVVLFLHGRHTSCNGSGSNPARWPCLPTQTNIPSYAGYDGAAEALASHGYAVISIGANAINSNDNQLALDYGAQARGRLILDTLEIFEDANAGVSTTLYDAQTDREVTLADALSGNEGLPAAGLDDEITELTPQDLVGRLDFSRIGLMGHSRGGEGVTSAATLNAALDDPFDIVSILPLAPVDFGRMTTPDIPTMLLLPYCDGDVSSQQGQHMNDDSRYAFDDDVLRTDVWVMGANHNFFNTVWTPSRYSLSTSDDWSGTNATSARSTDSVCGTTGAAVDTTIRLTDDEQYETGTTLMAGWFRLTVGGEDEFLPMFDGSGATVDSIADFDIRVSATQPASTRSDVATFTSTGAARTYGTATATLCASMSGRGVPQELPYCSTTLASAQLPHWTSVRFGGEVPASPMTRVQWTSGTGEIRVSVPRSARDASSHEFLTVKASPDESVAYGAGTDLSVTLVDGRGATFTTKVSDLNPNALVRLPQSTQNPTTLGKIVLQEVRLPLESVTGIDLTDVREVRFTAAVGLGGSVSGGVYLTDLAFASSALGTAAPATTVSVGTAEVRVEEGSGPDEVLVPVYLSQPATTPVTAYLTVIGGTTATAKAGMQMRKVVFAPGQVCTSVPVATYGDSAASTAATTAYTMSVTNTGNAVMGSNAFAALVVREDDGVTGGTPVGAFGVQGDPCAELTAQGVVTPGARSVAPGGSLEVAAGGFRPGESVLWSLGGAVLGSADAAADGSVETAFEVPADGTLGAADLVAVGAGSGITGSASVKVLGPTVTTLSVDPQGATTLEPVTLEATVEGTDAGTDAGTGTAGEVTFTDGATVLGTVEVVENRAVLAVPGFAAGEHSVTATFGETATAAGSSSQAVSFTVAKRGTTAFATAPTTVTVGGKVTGKVTVKGGSAAVRAGGKVTVQTKRGSGAWTTAATATVTDGTASYSFTAPTASTTLSVRAVYAGDAVYTGSTSAAATVTVAKLATTTTVAAPSRGKVGTPVAFTAKVAPGDATGKAQIWSKVGSGGWKLVRTVAVGANGAVSSSVTPTSTAKLQLKVVYTGSGSHAASTGTASVSVSR